MPAESFTDKLLGCAERNDSWLCVGLDPSLDKLPSGFRRAPAEILRFNRAIIDATADLVCAYKPNAAFYECLGREGWDTLKGTIDAIPSHIPVILDAKRGDIGNTAAMYAKSAYEELNADAVTVSPFLGTDSLDPFLKYTNRGVIVLCLTSNPGARDFQVKNNLHIQIAEMSNEWAKKNGNVALVVGATQADPLGAIRAICPDRLFLVPGIGAQGGSLEATVRAGAARSGLRLIINASRGVIQAGSGPDFADASRVEAERLRDGIRHVHSQTRS